MKVIAAALFPVGQHSRSKLGVLVSALKRQTLCCVFAHAAPCNDLPSGAHTRFTAVCVPVTPPHVFSFAFIIVI